MTRTILAPRGKDVNTTIKTIQEHNKHQIAELHTYN